MSLTAIDAPPASWIEMTGSPTARVRDTFQEAITGRVSGTTTWPMDPEALVRERKSKDGSRRRSRLALQSRARNKTKPAN
jgi:hypothetical protein